eukprot:TRINITY_DN8949_c0_g1_i1.p1 TRINITY_DN8949_c0_g1~~TRINITY_DN8949_c0_g1_i1.p1  ORF type:complete len:275 (-),score=58.17 TRINITY_DN8949_c0_g1_i1:93-917(-)
MRSKRGGSTYEAWMTNMLSLQDGMVIFTDEASAAMILSKRKGRASSTVVMTSKLSQSTVATRYGAGFWEQHKQCDPELKIHKSADLYWVWLEKSQFVKQAVEMNIFNSEFFAWIDIGYFRTTTFNNQHLLQKIPPLLKKDQVLMLNIKRFEPAELRLHPDGHLVHRFFGTPPSGAYVGGGFIGGYAPGLLEWHTRMYRTLDDYQRTGHFLGKDQPIMVTACLEKVDKCYLVPWPKDPPRNYGDLWFFMSPVLHGDVPDRWMAPSVTPEMMTRVS